jgi:hypothetical protein
LQQPYDYSKEHGARLFEEDPGWSWTRRAIATLLDAGFEAKDAEIPVALRKFAWTPYRAFPAGTSTKQLM